MIRDYRPNKPKWIAAKIKEVLVLNVTHTCHVSELNTDCKRHIDQIIRKGKLQTNMDHKEEANVKPPMLRLSSGIASTGKNIHVLSL